MPGDPTANGNVADGNSVPQPAPGDGNVVVAVVSLTVEPTAASVDDNVRLTVGVSPNSALPAGSAVSIDGLAGNDALFATGNGLDAAGSYTAVLRAQQAGVRLLTARVAGAPAPATASLTWRSGPAVASATRLSVADGNARADGAAGATVSAAVVDRFGNPVPAAPVAFQSEDANLVFVPALAVADAGGVAHTTVQALVAGTSSVSAFVGAEGVHADVHFLPAAEDANRSLWANLVSPTAADGHAQAYLQATLIDRNGLPVPNVSVAASANDDALSFDANVAVTDAVGVAAFRLSSNKVGAFPVVATFGDTGAQKTVVVPFSAGAVSLGQSALVLSANVLVADGQARVGVSVALRDARGNPVAAAPVSLAGDREGVAVSPAGGVTDANGQLTASLSGTRVGAATLSAVVPTGSLSAAVQLLPGAASAARSSLGIAPSAVTADGNAAQRLTVTLADALGNPVAGEGVQCAAPDFLRFVSADAATDANGQALLQAVSTVAGNANVSCSAGNVTLVGTCAFVDGPVSSTLSTLTAAPSAGATANGNAPLTIRAHVVDAFGNPIEQLPIAVMSDEASDVLSPAAGTTDANGDFVLRLVGTRAGPRTVEAQAGGVGVVGVATLLAGAVDPAKSAWTALPGLAVADGNATIAATVVARDAFGNAVPAGAVQFDTDAAVIVTTRDAALSADGSAHFSFRSLRAGPVRARAQVGGTSLTQSVSFVAGDADAGHSILLAAPGAVQAGGAPSALTGTVRDSHDNPLVGVPWRLVSVSGRVAIQPQSGVTDANGAFATSATGTLAALERIEGSVAGITPSVSLRVLPGAVASASSELTLEPNVLAGDTLASATLTLLARDAFGSPVPGAPVSFSTGAPLAAYVRRLSTVTDANGRWQGLVSGSALGPVPINVQSGNARLSTSANFVPGAPDADACQAAAVPAIVVANGQQSASVRFLAADAAGHPLAGQVVQWTSDGASPLSDSATTTDATGTATVSVSSLVAHDTSVQAQLGSVASLANVSFVSGPADANASSLVVAAAPPFVGDDAATAPLQLTLSDAFGNAVGNANVSWQALGSRARLALAADTTDALGRASATVANAGAGSVVVQASFGAQSLSRTVAFTPGLPSAARSGLWLTPSKQLADGNQAMWVTAAVADAWGSPLAGQAVHFSTDGTAIAVTPTSTTLDAAGRARGVLKSGTAQDFNVTATAAGLSLAAAAHFVADANDAYLLTLTAEPNTFVADGNAAAHATLTVLDASMAPVVGQAVQWRLGGLRVALAAADAATDANGRATAAVTSLEVQPVDLVAELEGGSTAITVSAVAGPPDANHAALAVSPARATADGAAALTATVALADAQGHASPNVAVRWALAGNALAADLTDGLTNADGRASVHITSLLAQAGQVVATAGNLVLQSPLSFVAGAPDANQSSVTLSSSAWVADGTSRATAQVHVADARGNAVAMAPVALSSAGPALTVRQNGNVTLAPLVTDANGTATATVESTQAGSGTLLCNAFGVTFGTPFSVTAGPLDAARSSASVVPARVVADGNTPASVWVTLADAFGNAKAGLDVVWGAGRSSTLLAPSRATSAADGSARSLAYSALAAADRLTASVSDGNVAVSLSANVTFVAGAPSLARSYWWPHDANFVADANAAGSLRIHWADAQNNPVAGQSVLLGASGADVGFVPAVVQTDAAGNANVTFAATQASNKALTATIADATLSTPVRVVAAAPSAATSGLSASPNQVSADGTSVMALQASLRDAFGNPTAGQPVTFSSSPNVDVLPAAGTTTLDDGTATASLRTTAAGTRTFSARFGSPERQITVLGTFLPGAPSSTRSALVASPNAVVADGAQAMVVTVTARDRFGSPVPEQAISLATGGTAITLSPAAARTDARGVVQFSLLSRVAQATGVTATLGQASVSVPVQFVAGPPSAATSRFVVQPNRLLADAQSSAALQVLALDAQGNPCPGQAVSFSAADGANVLLPPATQTDAAGQAAGSVAGGRAGSPTLLAQVGNLTLSTSLTLLAGAPSAQTSLLAIAPNVLVAGATQANVVVTAIDATGNPSPNVPVRFGSTAASDQLSATSNVTDAAGRAVARLLGTVAGRRSITAELGQSAISANVTVVPAAASATASTFLASPSSAVADGNQSVSLGLSVKDAFGNALDGAPMSISATGSRNVLSPASGTADANGLFYASLASMTPQAKVAVATVGNVSISADVRFVNAASAPNTLMLTATPNVLLADGLSECQLTLIANDVVGNRISQAAVDWQVSGTGSVLGVSQGATDANGVASNSLAATRAQQKTIRATLGGITVSTFVQFNAGSIDLSRSSVHVSPATIAIGAAGRGAVSVQLFDTFNNPVPGAALTASLTGTLGSLSADSGISDAAGSWSAAIASARAEPKQIIVNVDGGSLSANVTFVPGTIDNGNSSLVVSPNVVLADGTSQATVLVSLADAAGNPVVDQELLFFSNQPNDVIAPASARTDGSGDAATSLRSLQSGPRLFRVQAGATSLFAPLQFVAGGPKAATSSLTVSPNQAVADGDSSALVAVRLRDGAGNPVVGRTVTWSASAPSLVGLPAGSTTDASGAASAAVTSTVAGDVTLTAAFNGFSLSGNLRLVAGPVSAAQSTLTVSPTSLTADGNQSAYVRVALADAYGNAVAAAPVSLRATGADHVWDAATSSAGLTDGSGTFVTRVRSTRAQIESIVASVPGTSLSAPLTFVAGSPSAQTVALALGQNQVVAGGSVGMILSALDGLDNPVANANVDFRSSVATDVLANASQQTDAGGQAVARASVRQSGLHTLAGTIADITVSQPLAVLAATPNATRSSLAAPATATTADGNSVATFVLTARDAFDNPVPLQAVVFDTTNGDTSLSPSLGNTGAVASPVLLLASSRVAGSKHVRASMSGVVLEANALFVAGPASNATTSWVATPNVIVADGASRASFALVAKDAAGNPALGHAVSFSSGEASDVFEPPSAVVDANGFATTRVRATVSGPRSIVASLDGTSLVAALVANAGDANASKSALSVSPNQLVANGVAQATLSASLRDAFGNAVPNVRVAFVVPDASTIARPASALTDASGQVVSQLQGSGAGSKVVWAQTGNFSLGANVTFVADLASSATSTLTATPAATGIANGNDLVTLRLQALDPCGNPVANANVTFASTDANDRLAPAARTDAAGQAVTTLASTHAGARTASAHVQNANVAVAVTLLGGPAASANSVLAINPTTAAAGQSVAVTVLARDAFGNAAALQNVAFGGDARLAFSGAPARTDATGAATAQASATVAASLPVSASVGNALVAGNVTFTPAAPDASHLSLAIAPNVQVADAVAAVGLVGTARDMYGNAIGGRAVSFASSANADVFAAAGGNTQADGTFTSSVRSSLAGTRTLTFSANGASTSGNALFVAGSPNAARSQLGVSPSAAVANGTDAIVVTARVRDAFANPASGQNVSFAVDSAGCSLDANAAVTDDAGTAVTRLRCIVARSVTLSAQSGNAQLAQAATFVPGPVAAATSSLAATPNAVVADGAAQAAIRATARDAYGNAIGGQSVLLSAAGVDLSFAAVGGTTDANGRYQTTATSTVAEGKPLMAAFGNVTVAGTALFVPGPVASGTSALVAAPASQEVANTNGIRLTATARDAFSNRIASQAVSLAVAGNQLVLQDNNGVTDGTGSWSTWLRTERAQAAIPVATFAPGVTASSSLQFLAAEPNAAQSQLQLAPAVPRAGSQASLSVRLRDAFGNAASGQNVALSSTSPAATQLAAGVATDANGLASTPYTVSTTAPQVLTATSGNATLTLSFSPAPAAPDAGRSSYAVTPNVLVADGIAQATVRAQLVDPFGNAVANTAYGLSASGTANALGQTSGTTDANGALAIGLQSIRAETKAVALTVSGVAFVQNVTFVAGSPNAAQSSVLASPNSAVANGSAAVSLVATVRDAFANPVANQTVAFGAAGGNVTVSPSSATTDANGRTSSAATSVVAGNRTLTAQAGAASVSVPVAFVAGAPAAATSSLVASPNEVAAGDANGIGLSLVAADAFGNRVPQANVMFAAPGGNTLLAPSAATTDASGGAVARAKSTLAQAQNVLATFDNGVQMAAPVRFVAAAANTVVPASAAPALVAGQAASIGATVRDAYGNPVPSQGVSFAVSGGNATVTPASAATNAAGQASSQLLASSIGNVTVTATAAGISGTLLLPVNAASPNAGTSSWSAVPTTFVAGDANGSTATLVLRDAFGNAAGNVSLALASTDGADALAPTALVTDANGMATAALRGTHAGSRTWTASAGNVSLSATVGITAASPNAARSLAVVAPATLVADGQASADLKATVLDAFGNPVPNQSLTATATGSQTTLSPNAATTDANGVAHLAVRSTRAEAKTLSVAAGPATVQAAVTFVAGAPNGTYSNVTVSPATVTADNVSQANVTVLIGDAFGNPVPNQNLALSSNNAGASFAAATATTNGAGQAVTTVRSSVAGTASVRAATSDGAAVVSTSLQFVAGAPSATTSTLSASPNAVAVDNANGIALSLIARDAFGNAVGGTPVSFAASGGNTSFAATGGNTDVNGALPGVVRATQAQGERITATFAANGAAVGANVVFLSGTPNATLSSLSAAPAAPAAGQNANLTLIVRDGFGNRVAGKSVALSATGTSNAFGATSVTTDANGQASTTYASNKAEHKAITASAAPANIALELNVVPSAPTSGQSSLAFAGNNTVADNVATVALRGVLRDAYNNPTPNQSVALTSNGTNDTFAATGVTTDANGAFDGFLRSSRAQNKTVTATSSGASVSATTTFVAGSPNAAASAIAASPNVATANGSSAISLSATFADAFGNPTPSVPVTFSVTGQNGTLSPTTATTSTSGVADATLVSTAAESKTVTAQSGNAAVQVGVQFVPGSSATANSTLLLSPNAVVVDELAGANLQLSLRDSNNNAVQNVNVTLSASGDSTAFSPASGSTDANGNFNALVRSTVAQVESISAAFEGNQSLSAQMTFLATSPNASRSAFAASPTGVSVGSSSTLSATVRDRFANVVAGAAIPLTADANASLSAAQLTSASDGTAGATLSSNRAGTWAANANFAGTLKSTGVTFTSTSPNSTTSSIGLSPSSVTANGTATITVTVTVRDAYNNTVANQPVALSASGANNTFSPQNGNTNASGVLSASLSSTTAQAKVVTAAAGPASVSANVTFNAGAPNATQSSVVLSPASQVADNASLINVTATVRDAFANVVPSQTVSLSSSGTGNSFSVSGGSTNASGVLTSALRSSKAESKTVTATAAGVSFAGSGAFTAGPVSASTSTLSVSPSAVVADNASTIALVATLKDVNGNLVSGQNVTFAASTGNVTVTPATGVASDGNGQSQATARSALAHGESVTATAGNVTLSANVTFTPGAASASTSTVSVAQTPVVASDTNGVLVTAVARDAQGNPIANANVSWSASGGNNVFSTTGGTADANGQHTTVLRSTQQQNETVTATFGGGAAASANVAFVAASPNAARSALALTPATNLVAGGTEQVVATARDAFGNLCYGALANVTVAPSADVTLLASSASLGAAQSGNDFRATKAELKQVTAAFAGASLSGNLQVVAASPNASQTTVSASPNTATANNVAAITVSAIVRDAYGNAVAGQTMVLTASGGDNTISPALAVSDANGRVSAQVTSTWAQNKTFTWSTNDTTPRALGTATGKFVAGSPNATSSSLSAASGNAVADDNSLFDVYLFLRDAYGNSVSGAVVSLSASGSNNTLSSTSIVTDGDGNGHFTIRSKTAESKVLTATIGSTSLSTTVLFEAGSATNARSLLTLSPNSIAAGSGQPATALFAARDAYGNAVTDLAVRFSASGASTAIASPNATTASDGNASTTLGSTVAQNENIVATAGNVQLAAALQVTAASPNATKSSVVLSPNSLVVGNSATLTAAIADAFANPVGGQGVSFAVSGGGASASPASATTDANGRASSSITATVAEAKTVTATAGSASVSAGVTFTAASPNSSRTTLAASPNTAATDDANGMALLATVRDAYGNAVSGQAVSFASSGQNETFSPATATTNSGGQATSVVTSTLASSKALTVTAGPATASVAATFTSGAPNVANSAVAAQPNTTGSPNTFNQTTAGVATRAFVTLVDGTGNKVPGKSVTLAVTLQPNTAIALSPNAGTTASDANGNGTFATVFTPTQAGNYTLSASAAGFAKSANFVVAAASPNQATSALSASPLSATANGQSAITLATVVRDAFANPVPGQGVTYSATGSNAAFGAAGGTTDANGRYATTLSSTKAETKAVQAAFGGLTLAQNVTFVPGPALTASSSFTLTPNVRVADNQNAATLQVSVADANGNPVAGQAIALSSSGSGDTFNPNGGVADANGNFSAALSSTKAEGKTITMAAGGASLAANVTFVAGAPADGCSTFGVPTSDVTGTYAVLSATLRDAFGNACPGATVQETITNQNTSVVQRVIARTTDASGADSYSYDDRTAGRLSVNFLAGSANRTLTYVRLPGTASSSKSTVAASPSTNVVANGQASVALSGVVMDDANNRIANQNVSVSSSGSNNTFAATALTTDANGAWSTSLVSTKAEGKTLSYVAGTANGSTSATFVAGAPNATTSRVVLSPTTQVADNTNIISISVQVADAFGNAVGNQNVSLAVSGGANALGSAAGTTSATGVWTSSLRSSLAEAKTVTATAGPASFSQSATFVAGPPASGNTTVVASPNGTVTADNSNAFTMTVTVADGFGNRVSNQNVALSTSDSAVLSATSGTTDASGQVSSLLRSKVAASNTVSATAGPASANATVTFVAGAASSANMSLTASPATQTADNSNTVTLLLTVKDGFDNPVSGQSVSFSSTGGNNTFAAGSGTTASNGQYSTVLRSSRAEAKTITGAAGSASANVSATFVAGAPNATTSSLTASPSSNVVANNANTSSLLVTVLDQFGNAASGVTVSLSANNGNTTLSPVSGSTNASGQLTATAKSSLATSTTVTAAFGGVSETATIGFVAGSPNATRSSIATSSGSLVASDTSTVSISGTFRDAFGNANPAQSISSFASSGSNNRLSATSGTTDSSGNFSFTYGSSKAEAKTVSATAAGATVNVGVTVVASSPNRSLSSVSLSPATASAAQKANVVATVRIADSWNNAVSAVAIVPGYMAQDAFVAPPRLTTDSSGQAAFNCQAAGVGKRELIFNTTAGFGLVANANFSTPTATCSATKTPMFSAPKAVAGPIGMNKGLLADVNGDGNQDVIVSGVGNNQNAVWVLLNQGWGNMGAFNMVGIPNCQSAAAIASADLNGDGRSDLVVACGNSNVAQVSLATASGTFTSFSTLSAGITFDRVAIGDADNDSKLDVVVASATNTLSYTFHGDGAGGFGSGVSKENYYGKSAILLADFTGDGRADYLYNEAGASTIHSLPTNTSGNFGTSAQNFAAPGVVKQFVAKDLNADGKMDLMVMTGDANVYAYLGNGNCTFQPIQVTPVPGVSSLVGLDSFDIDNDGVPDVVSQGNSRLIPMIGRADGTFAIGTAVENDWDAASFISHADLNGDGKADLVSFTDRRFIGYYTPAYGRVDSRALLNVPSTLNVDVGDFDADGVMDVVAMSQSGGVYFVRGLSANAFAQPTLLTTQPVNSSIGQANLGARKMLMDIDGDGLLDVLPIGGSPNCVPLYNNGNRGVASNGRSDNGAFEGTYNAPLSWATFVDIDGDGVKDAMYAQEKRLVWRYYSKSTSRTPDLARGTFSFAVANANALVGAAGDINYDGLVDAVVAADDGNAYVLLNSGGNFTALSSAVSLGGTTVSFAGLADLTGDGVLDLYAMAGSVVIATGTSSGTFGSAAAMTSSNSGALFDSLRGGYVDIADFNGDGLLDLVGLSGNGVSIQINQGSKSFQSTDSPWAAFWAGMVAADVDGDGKPDVVTGSTSQGRLGVLWQGTCR